MQRELDSATVALTCANAGDLLNGEFPPSNASLRARARQANPATDPCVVLPEARYRGVENQLYRVEIHQGGKALQAGGDKKSAATFKWSRENGSATFPVVDLATDTTSNTTTVTLADLGRDRRLGLQVGDWVEFQDDNAVASHTPLALQQVTGVDQLGLLVTLQGIPVVFISTDAKNHPLMRRWDQKGDPALGGALSVVEGTGEKDTDWIALEEGIQIQFTPGGIYAPGDYWLVPARKDTGDVEWKQVPGTGTDTWVAGAEPARHLMYHYAPLAIIATDAEGFVAVQNDCRCLFQPLSCFAP